MPLIGGVGPTFIQPQNECTSASATEKNVTRSDAFGSQTPKTTLLKIAVVINRTGCQNEINCQAP